MSQTINYGTAGDAAYGIYYKHSNRVPISGLLLGAIAGLAVGLLGAVVYAYAIVYIPIIYANVACVVAFGALLGWAPARMMKWGKVRSVPVVLIVVGAITLAAYYFHWVVWICALFQQSGRTSNGDFETLLRSPNALAQIIGAINKDGTWAMHSGQTAVSGIALSIIWLGEAAGIFAMAFYIALLSQSELPFCERCDGWCPKGTNLLRLAPANAFVLRKRMEEHDWAAVKQVGPPSGGSPQWVTVIHHACPTCNKLHTLSAKMFTTVTDKRGRSRNKEKMIVKKVLVSPEDIASLSAVSGLGEVNTPAT
jgi:hypothetical protein